MLNNEERIPVLITNRTDLAMCLKEVWTQTPKTKSDFARKFASELGALCSEGLITTRFAPRQYTDRWYITAQGLEVLDLGELI